MKNIIKKRLAISFLLTPLLLAWSGVSLAKIAPPECSIKVHKSLIYGEGETTAGTERLFMDLYVPRGEPKRCTRKFRVVLLIHGGGFTSGSRKQEELVVLANDFVRSGYAVASIDYRLLKKHSQPVLSEEGEMVSEALGQVNPPVSQAELEAASAATMDALKAAQWLHKNRRQYNLRMKKMIFAGGSAGAITALNAAYLLPELGLYKKAPEPKAVIDFWGAYIRADLLDENDPPMFVVHGTSDKTVPFDFSRALVGQADKLGIDYEFYPIKGAGHGFDDIPINAVEVDGITLQQRAIDFADRILAHRKN